MERLTYYRLADSENMGYYLKPDVAVHEAIQWLGEIESNMQRLRIDSVSELVKLLTMVQFTGSAWKIRRSDRCQSQMQFGNIRSIEEKSKGEQGQERVHKWIGLDEFEQEWRIED